MGKTACTKAAEYPKEMCTEVLKAVAVIKKGIEETQLYGVDREDMCEDDEVTEQAFEAAVPWCGQDYFYEGLRDSSTGEELDASKVRAGCDEELEYMKHMSVWDRAQVRDKVIGTRWVYVKKPNQVRCRLVAQEFAGSEKREDLYAGTPPMAATRYLLSDTVSRGRARVRQKRKLMVLDVKRAFLHGIATRTIYVELPGEESENGKYVGRLNRTPVWDQRRPSGMASSCPPRHGSPWVPGVQGHDGSLRPSDSGHPGGHPC